MRRAGRIVATAAVLAASYASTANAQQAAHDAAAAEAAFAEARALIRQGDYAAACPKLEISYALDPALGTLLNLGDCFERTGRTATAWVRYREAAAMAVEKNQRAREAIARARVAALEPRLCRLVVRAEGRADLEVQRDGVPLPREAIGLPVPVDPGAHVIVAKAPGATPFSTRVDVRAPDGDAACPQTVVDIPLLEGERASTAAGVVPLAPIHFTAEDTAPPSPSPSSSPSRWGTMHTLAVVAAAGGLTAIGVGSVFALQASSTNSDAETKCTNAGCTLEGKSLLADAGKSADVATVTLVAGAVLVTTGVVLWLASPSLRAGGAGVAGRDVSAGFRF